MHIPDHFVSAPLNGTSAVLALAFLGYSFVRVRRSERQDDKAASSLPLASSAAAFVFAAQMVNFPVGGGTSGHFLGAAALTAFLGPWSASLVMAAVLAVQAFLFGDGGIESLGTNIVNMGICGVMVAHFVMRGMHALDSQNGRIKSVAALAVGSWASVVAASALCAAELALSGTSPLAIAMPAMLKTHASIGVGEAAITLALAAALVTVPRALRIKNLATSGLVVALVLAMIGGPLASALPDGLEKTAQDTGFAQTVSSGAPLADYTVQGIANEKVSTGIAGFIGTLAVFFVSSIPGALARRRLRAD